VKKFLSLIIILSAVFAYAEDPEGVEFSIRFYDKTVYYTNSPVFIKAELDNDSADTYRFRIAESRVFNVDFDVRTLTNSALPHSREFSIQRNTNQPVFVREISLEPGEQYSFIEELSNFIEIDSSGVYVVRAHFFPELATDPSGAVLVSNPLSLTVRPDVRMPSISLTVEEETGEILQRSPLPPDEAVAYMLKARQKSQWQKFFLYLDVDSIMLRDPDKERRYKRLSEEEQIRMVEEFREDLTSERTDSDIIIIPDEFEIIQTKYTPQEATVDVIEKFVYSNFTEKKRYIYYLHRPEGIWMIYNYEVRNLGTE